MFVWIIITLIYVLVRIIYNNDNIFEKDLNFNLTSAIDVLNTNPNEYLVAIGQYGSTKEEYVIRIYKYNIETNEFKLFKSLKNGPDIPNGLTKLSF